jgi:hypothetical protein
MSACQASRIEGANGYRVRACKAKLARLAAETGLQITVCHLPPGTSNWNRIEHRLIGATTTHRACGSAPSWTVAATAAST